MKVINHANVANHLLSDKPGRAIVKKHSREIGGICSADDVRKLQAMDPQDDDDDQADDEESQRHAAAHSRDWVTRSLGELRTLDGTE